MILQNDGLSRGNYNGHDIINALIAGFEQNLNFELLSIVLEDCPQYPNHQKTELLEILNAFSTMFNGDEILQYKVKIEDDMVYHMETEDGKDISNIILEEQGYKQIIFTLFSEIKIKNLKYGGELSAGMSFYYLIDKNNNLLTLFCNNRTN